MARSVSDIIQRLKYLWNSTGLVNTFRRIARKLVSPLFETDVAYIAIRYYRDKPISFASYHPVDEQGITTAIFERSDELESLDDSVLDEELRSTLRNYLETGPNRTVLVSLRPRSDDRGVEFIGYLVFDRAEFSYWNGRLKGPLPSDCIFNMAFYIVPKYRGQRMHLGTRKAQLVYCHEHGIKKTMGFVKPSNTPSIKAHMYLGENSFGTLNGTIRRTTFLGGLYERITPSETVLSIIKAPTPKS